MAINSLGTPTNVVGPNHYDVGCYIMHSKLKNVKWPVSSQFGEDILYNKYVCKEASKYRDKISYIDKVKHIYVKHPLSTTWTGRNMLWWKR
jgi:hypothetical protein